MTAALALLNLMHIMHRSERRPLADSDDASPSKNRKCCACGAPDLLADVRLTTLAAGANDLKEERTVLLCPACLAESINTHRRQGGTVEAHLQTGRVVRW